MSDVAVVTPAAPAVAPATPAPSAPVSPPGEPSPSQPEGAGTPIRPANAQEALQRAHDRAKGITVATAPETTTEVPTEAPEKVVDANGYTRNKAGEFASPEGEQAPSASDGEATETEAATASDELVTIPLPEGHPLRDRGLTEFPVPVPKEHEDSIRGILNGAVRKAELQQAHQAYQQLNERLLETEAQLKYWRDNPGSRLTPEEQHKVNDIRETYGDEDADRYEAALREKRNSEVEELTGAELAEARQKHLVQMGQMFRQEALRDVPNKYPGWASESIALAMGQGPATPEPGSLADAFAQYGAYVQARTMQDQSYMPNARDWYAVADRVFASSPAGQQAQRQAQAEADAKEAERKKLEAATEAARRNPLGGVTPVPSTTATPSVTRARPQNAAEAVQWARERARGVRQ